MNNLIIIIAVILILMYFMNKREPYSTVSIGNRYGRTDPSYTWRTYNHDPYYFHKYEDNEYDFPYNYNQKPYYARYTKYMPYFHHYGYGNL
jgi:hypothetical protein